MKGAISAEDMREILNARCRTYGSATALAEQAEVTVQYISVVRRKRSTHPVPAKIARALGYEPVVVYVPTSDAQQEEDDAEVQG